MSRMYFLPGNYWSKSVFPLPGNEYKIVVKAQGFPDATATTTIPNPIKIERIDTSRIILPDSLSRYMPSNVCLICNIEFTDPGNETNYYLFNIWKTPGNGSYDMGFDCQDPIVEEKIPCIGSARLEGIAFTDKIINGQKYSLTVKIYGANIGKPFWNGDTPIIIKKPFISNFVPLLKSALNIFKRLTSIIKIMITHWLILCWCIPMSPGAMVFLRVPVYRQILLFSIIKKSNLIRAQSHV